MDWFFNGLNDFFQLTFKGMRSMVHGDGNYMNTFLVLVTAALTTYWFVKMIGHARQEKK